MGGSAFLPHLHDNFGYYLALTGNRIRWGGACKAASQPMPLRQAIWRMCATISSPLAISTPRLPAASTRILKPLSKYASLWPNVFRRHAGRLYQALERAAEAGNKSARDILTVMATRSPTSLAVTFRQLADGRPLGLDDCMRMEYRIIGRMLEALGFL
ncbi:enoyl-CoA hydratase/isomerase family protein [Brucella abortus]|nr:enoyl-CoA hydratase/isomerase family protein [Brucella abortus]